MWAPSWVWVWAPLKVWVPKSAQPSAWGSGWKQASAPGLASDQGPGSLWATEWFWVVPWDWRWLG